MDLTKNINKRIEWIDSFRGFLFYFVIITHSAFVPKEFHWVYDPFFLTGFFFISGIVYRKKNIIKSIHSVATGLFLPWLTMTLFVCSSFGLILYGSGNYLQQLYENIIQGHSMWFICCLIVIELLHIILDNTVYNRIKKLKYIALLLSLVSIYFITSNISHRMPWNIDTAIWCYSYFLLGNISKELYQTKFFNNSCFSILSIIILPIALLYLGTIDIVKEMDMCSNVVPCPTSFLISSILSDLILSNFFRIFIKNRKLSKAGRYTLFFFCFHNYFDLALKNIYNLVGLDVKNDAIYYLILPISAFCIYIILFYIALYLERIHPLLVGKNYDIKKKFIIQ